MKKSVLFIFLLAISISGFSQTFVLEEYFVGPLGLPATWTTIDQDGDTYNWGFDTWDNPAGFLEDYATSSSWINSTVGAVTPENYLITPQINLTGFSGTLKLRYTIQVTNDDYPAEHYKVAVSTTGNTAADFTTIVKEETCTAADYYDTYPYWHERIVDLTQFIGQNIYLTWCHYDCTDQEDFLLDSVQVIYNTDVSTPDFQQANVVVYPNPASEKILVTGSFENAQLKMFTVDGRQVFQVAEVSKQVSVNVSTFENGVYVLRIESPKGIITKKVNISH